MLCELPPYSWYSALVETAIRWWIKVERIPRNKDSADKIFINGPWIHMTVNSDDVVCMRWPERGNFFYERSDFPKQYFQTIELFVSLRSFALSRNIFTKLRNIVYRRRENIITLFTVTIIEQELIGLRRHRSPWRMPGTAGILQICNTARHNVVIIYVPIYHAFY